MGLTDRQRHAWRRARLRSGVSGLASGTHDPIGVATGTQDMTTHLEMNVPDGAYSIGGPASGYRAVAMRDKKSVKIGPNRGTKTEAAKDADEFRTQMMRGAL